MMFDLGVALTNRFPQSADDLLNRLEAFLINNNRDTLTSDSMGKFEMYLHQENQKVNLRILLITCTLSNLVSIWISGTARCSRSVGQATGCLHHD